MKKLFPLILLFLSPYYINAQSPQDNPCGAITIPVIESADPCIPVRDPFTGITYVAYSIIGTNTCSPSFATDPDVWYKFTATYTSVKLQILPTEGVGPPCGFFSTGSVEFVVLTGNCNGPFTYVQCGRSDEDNTLTLNNLTLGTVYYIKITAGLNDCGSLGCCVYTNVPPSTSKVGINTKLPSANLDVAGDVVFRNNVTLSANLDVAGDVVIRNNVTLMDTINFSKPISFGSSSNGNKISLFGGLSGNHFGLGIQPSHLQLYTDYATSDIIFGYGNSNSFTERAHIINFGQDGMILNGRLTLRNGTTDINNGAGIWLYKPDNSSQLGFIGVQNNTNIGIFGGPTIWGFIYNTANGRIGINNNTPDAQLAFSPTLEKKITLYPGGTGDAGMSVAGNDFRLYCDNVNARISFGYDDNSGGFTSRAYVPASGTTAMVVQGNLSVNGTTYTSDSRFKKDITTLANPLQKLMQLRGVTYHMRTDAFPAMQFDSGNQVGLIAQEVEKIIPEVVSTNSEGYKSVDYAKLVPLLIEAIKEQQKEIDQLKKTQRK